LAVASGQDREPISLEQLPNGILFIHIVFGKQNHHWVYLNLFNGRKAVALQVIAATSYRGYAEYAECIVAPERQGGNRRILMEKYCSGRVNPEGTCGDFGLA
jgi:hypothetical protein